MLCCVVLCVVCCLSRFVDCSLSVVVAWEGEGAVRQAISSQNN